MAPAGPAEPIPGRRPVIEALRSGREVVRVFVADTARDEDTLRELVDLARSHGVDVQRVTPQRVTQVAGTDRHQGVVAMARPQGPMTVQDLLQLAASRGQDPFVVAVDGVQDPQNLGAIARSALLAGAHGLVVPERGTASVGPGAAKASAGALSLLAVAEVSSVLGAIAQLQRAGVWVVGMDVEGSVDLWNARLTGPVAIVMGSEHEGLSPAAQKAVDERVRIPTPGGDLSLNVSAAAAVVLFERVRQARTRQRG